MCKRYSRGLAVSLLQLLLFTTASPLYSDEMLDECMTRLDRSITERESLVLLVTEYQTLIERQTELTSTYRILTRELTTSLSDRDERLQTIATSWSAIEQSARADRRRAYILGGAVGLAGGLVAAFFLSR